MNPVERKGFVKGINNIAPDFALPPDALRDAYNIDLYETGKFNRRSGSVKLVPLSGAHSFWSNPKDPRPQISYYVAGSTMYSFKIVNGSPVSTAIITGLAPGMKVVYIEVNGEVFWSNGLITGRIRANGQNSDWGIETPASYPFLTAGISGSLFPGKYQIALTFRNAAGEEGGTGKAQSVDVAINGSITLTGMPQPVSGEVTTTCIYATGANGDALFKIAEVPSSTTSFTISTVANATTALKTQFLQPMLPCTRLAHLGGIIYGAVGNYVYFTDPFRYGLCNVNKSFYGFPAQVDELLTVPDEAGIRPLDGLYVCADKTYFVLRAGSNEAEQKIVLPFGAVPGTGTYLKNGTECTWFSPRGQITASVGGHAKVTNEENYLPGYMVAGTSIVREKNGLKQIINTVVQSQPNPIEYQEAST